MVDCINKMNEYSANDKERNRIAKNGYRKVLENHTQIEISIRHFDAMYYANFLAPHILLYSTFIGKTLILKL